METRVWTELWRAYYPGSRHLASPEQVTLWVDTLRGTFRTDMPQNDELCAVIDILSTQTFFGLPGLKELRNGIFALRKSKRNGAAGPEAFLGNIKAAMRKAPDSKARRGIFCNPKAHGCHRDTTSEEVVVLDSWADQTWGVEWREAKAADIASFTSILDQLEESVREDVPDEVDWDERKREARRQLHDG